jgi:hypothetical protein
MDLWELKENSAECSKSIYYDWLDKFKEETNVGNIKIVKLAAIL